MGLISRVSSRTYRELEAQNSPCTVVKIIVLACMSAVLLKRAAMTTASSIRMTYITCPDNACADKLAAGLIEKKLAACVNILPSIRSVYEWEGKVEKSEETVMLVKSRVELASDIKKYVTENHPYDEPAIVALVVDEDASAESFINWIKTQTK